MTETEQKVVEWAEARGIFEKATPHTQFTKLLEEVGEVHAELVNRDRDALELEMGDMMVVLTLLAKMYNTSLDTCYTRAYNKIKDRKGTMVNGQFVKETASEKP